MDWALLMRGTNSIASAVTRRSTSIRATSVPWTGRRSPIRVAPSAIVASRSADGGTTVTTVSARAKSVSPSTMTAPESR